MTALTLEAVRASRTATEGRSCIACRIILPLAVLEPVPSRPGLLRCRDEDACRERFTPRRLSRSVRTEAAP